MSCSGEYLPGQRLSHAALQALLLQDPGLKAQLVAALPAGLQLASNATAAGAVPAQALGPSSEAGDEIIDKRGASMLLGCVFPTTIFDSPTALFFPEDYTNVVHPDTSCMCTLA